jgi:hypothetical protein
MRIDSILKQIDLNNTNSYYTVETFLLNLLKVHQNKNDKPLELTNGNIGFDAFAKYGIEDIKGPTQIEIKFNLERYNSKSLLNRIFSTTSRYSDIADFDNLLIITPNKVSEKTKNRFDSRYHMNNFSFNIFIWGPEEINKIVNKNISEANDIANNIFSLRIENALIKPALDWKKLREKKLEELKQLYNKGQISLFLGAGVSSSAGMPDWNTLLNSLFVTYLTKEFDDETKIQDSDIKQIVSRLNEIDEPSALMAARYLRKGLDRNENENQEFNKVITENLYNLRDGRKKINSDLIKSIVNMCMPKRTGAKIKSVVTYNFDDLIERQLQTQAIQHHSIYTDNDFIDPDELPVYHVHGFLPESTENYNSLEKSTLVFSEEGYHLIYSDSYHWSNLVQLSNLRDNHCLMVGLSMTDPNLRRLLEISSRNSDRTRHFAFMKRITNENFTTEKDKKVIKNIEGSNKFLNGHHNLNEEIMKELGVSIIWYENYDEIPKILKKISK